jgi:hypothetical protein
MMCCLCLPWLTIQVSGTNNGKHNLNSSTNSTK